MVAARLKPIYEKEAKERQLAGLKQNSAPVSISDDPIAQSIAKHQNTVPPNLEERTNSLDNESSAQAAKVLNVSRASVASASAVITKADPSVTAAVDSGKLAVSTAAIIAQAPIEQQRNLNPVQIYRFFVHVFSTCTILDRPVCLSRYQLAFFNNFGKNKSVDTLK